MGHFSVEIMRLPGQLSVEINKPTNTHLNTAKEEGLTLLHELPVFL
jgi:hypothetical protein